MFIKFFSVNVAQVKSLLCIATYLIVLDDLIDLGCVVDTGYRKVLSDSNQGQRGYGYSEG